MIFFCKLLSFLESVRTVLQVLAYWWWLYSACKKTHDDSDGSDKRIKSFFPLLPIFTHIFSFFLLSLSERIASFERTWKSDADSVGKKNCFTLENKTKHGRIKSNTQQFVRQEYCQKRTHPEKSTLKRAAAQRIPDTPTRCFFPLLKTNLQLSFHRFFFCSYMKPGGWVC